MYELVIVNFRFNLLYKYNFNKTLLITFFNVDETKFNASELYSVYECMKLFSISPSWNVSGNLPLIWFDGGWQVGAVWHASRL